jgi:hypothetical protein
VADKQVELMKTIAPVIADHVQKAMEPFNRRTLELVARVTELEERLRWLKSKQ